jgi:hypothetical protein
LSAVVHDKQNYLGEESGVAPRGESTGAAVRLITADFVGASSQALHARGEQLQAVVEGRIVNAAPVGQSEDGQFDPEEVVVLTY